MEPMRAAQTTSPSSASAASLHRRQLRLFIVAVCLPGALLVVLGARTIVQDRQLAEKRLADHRQQLASGVARALVDRLERVKLEEAGAFAASSDGSDADRLVNGATVFVARVDSGGARAPWTEAVSGRVMRVLAEPVFAARIARAMRAELVEHRYSDAAAAYRGILRDATDSTQAAYAELLLARARRSTGEGGARASYLRLLRAPLSLRDEHGVPFAVYAARALDGDSVASRDVADFVRRNAEPLLVSRTLSPTACYALVEVAGVLNARQRCVELERSEVLFRDALTIASVRTSDSTGTGGRWAVYNDGRWMVSSAPATRTHAPLLIAVRLDSIVGAVSSLRTNGMRLVASNDPRAEPLGFGLQGLRVAWADGRESAQWRSTVAGTFYATSLALVLGVGLLGGYLLWRDVQREARLGQLRSQFVASVSHELRTPLTSIRVFAETLRDRAKLDPRMRAEYLDTIARESERLTRLLDNVLDFSRIERGERVYHPSSQILSTVVERALRTLRFPLEQHGFAVMLQCDADLPVIQCDADALEQAVLNLVSNAMKYSGESRRIEVRVSRHERLALIAVRDFGVGIAPAHQARLFERFYRAPVPENEVIPGTGLGLTLVEHIASAHGGHVTVESSVGGGSTFTMHLPFDASVMTAEAVAAPVGPEAPADATIA